MKRTDAEQDSIVSMLTRIYTDVCELETQYQLFAGEGDFRPRIEYFHDAVRAFTSGEARHREPGGRLTIEWLAYDVSCLKYLHAMPLSPFKPRGANLSPSTDMVNLDQLLVPSAIRPDRATKERIAELYQNYAMLFAALLKPFADADYMERVEALNQDVRSMNAVSHELMGKADMTALAIIVQHLEDSQLRFELVAFLKHAASQRDQREKMAIYLKHKAQTKDKEIQAIEKAHTDYAMAQLSIYENSRDVLKKMAQQGMNLVGNFVEASVRQTQREFGR